MTTRTHSRLDIPPNYYHTPSRTRFFDAYDSRPSQQPLVHFCKQHKTEQWCPSQPTASRWLQQRKEQVEAQEQSPTRRRRTQPRGRKRLDVSSQIETMATGPASLRQKDYQFHAERAGCSWRTLQRRMSEREPRVIRSKRPRTEQISEVNKAKRKDYGHTYKDETVESLWQWIHWTDEAHIDRAIAVNQYIFREEGNYEGYVMEEPAPNHLVLHIAASVSWHHKSDLIFYNDGQWTHSHLLDLWKAAKPRRNRRSKTEDQYQAELQQWQNSQPPETIKTGNTMTQQHYNEVVLPQHI